MKKCILICSLLVVLFGCSINAENSSVAIQVEDEEILFDEIANIFLSQYYDVVAENLISLKLIELKAKSLEIDTDLIKNSLRRDTNERQAQTDYELILTKMVLKKTIDDKTLKEYFDNNTLLYHDISATIYSINHEQGMKLITLYQRNKDLEKSELELDITKDSKITERISNGNILYDQVKDLKPGEITMVMSNDEHLIVFINDSIERPLEWPKDKDIISDEYLFINTYNEKIKLIESLKKEYTVQKADYRHLKLYTE